MSSHKIQHLLDIYGKEPATLDELGDAVVAVANTFLSSTTDPGRIVGLEWYIQYFDPTNPDRHRPSLDRDRFIHTDISWINRQCWQGTIWIRYSGYVTNLLNAFDNTSTYVSKTETPYTPDYSGPDWFYRYKNFIYVLLDGAETKCSLMSTVWHYMIYVEDWPLLQKKVLEEKTWHILGNKSYSDIHTYRYCSDI